jgi:RNase P subunit RPR2
MWNQIAQMKNAEKYWSENLKIGDHFGDVRIELKWRRLVCKDVDKILVAKDTV